MRPSLVTGHVELPDVDGTISVGDEAFRVVEVVLEGAPGEST